MTRRGRGSRLVALAVSCALLGISCGDPTSPDNTDVDRVEVSPAAVALTVGETRTITAQVFDANDAESWTNLARALLAIKPDQGSERYELPVNASGAAWNAYTRAQAPAAKSAALSV